ncbi:MAG: DUF6089 family protein [Bacteroidota bacterium]
MKPSFLLTCLLVFSATVCTAQPEWFANVGIGPINYVGDLQDKRFTTVEMKMNVAAGLSYQATPHFAANFSLMYGKIGATDAKNGAKWVFRNLNFQSSIFEASLTAEADLNDITQFQNGFTDQNPQKFTPYIFAGVGLFHFNPYTYDPSGKKVYLQPLGTEAQTTPYSLWAFSIPFGIGAKYALNNNILISAEFNVRKTFTDYIDDVSNYHYPDTTALAASHGAEAALLSYRADEIPGNTYNFKDGYRGNPTKKDGYYSFMIKLSYQLFTGTPKFYYGY